ncbi:PGN_0703 family putative restriction endonuclease [Methylobacterium sp. sgz302541]|uniref:PGN_0703 family putative restriction endonuclease n=1 Tax=unclassified Methylobacterium TaxID=2615210 RepID=UPI003D329544
MLSDPAPGTAVAASPFIQPLVHAPFLSETLRRQHHTFVANDSRFSASCRVLAHLWRQDQQHPAATFITRDSADKPRRRPANWLLRRDAAQAGATFLTPAIRDHARQALLFREPGALWNEDRLWGHLLSSQAMTVNLLATMAGDLTLATRVWRGLLPDLVGEVTRIRFEHSPGRFCDRWYGDGTALDALIEVITPLGEIAVIGAELKYVEGLTGPTATPRARYVEAARESGLYKAPDSPTLARAGFEQLRREQVMVALMLRHGLASRGAFVLIAPKLNRRAQAVAALYRTELRDPDGRNDPATVAFHNITLERIIAALHEAGAADLARQLWARYCDHARVAQFALHGDDPSSPPPAPNPVRSLPPPASTPETVPDEAPPPAITRTSRRRRPPATTAVKRSTRSATVLPPSDTTSTARGAR